jgi:DNA ligase D-like protein (predicted ligase)
MSLPDRLRPMLAVRADPFDAPDYFFEVKWDGWRCLAYLNGGVRLQSRNLQDLSPLFPELSAIHRAMTSSATLLDGEIVTFWEGKPSFIRLQRRRARLRGGAGPGPETAPAVFIAFDLLYLGGESQMNLPLEERRARLERYARPGDGALQISETITGQGRAFFASCQAMGLEGVVGKDRSSRYFPGKRSPSWKKVKALHCGLFAICGYTTAVQGHSDLPNAVALAAKVAADWNFCGLVGSGLNARTVTTLQGLLSQLRMAGPPRFAAPVVPPPRIQWVEPLVVCEVEYLELTPELRLRHPVWRGLRPDRSPEACLMV